MRALALFGLLLAGCVVDAGANPNRCRPDGGCPDGQRCHRAQEGSLGFCVPAPDAGMPTPDAGPDGGPDAGTDACVAMDEVCNGRDDDCDGEVDEDFNLRTPEMCGACHVRCETPNPDCVPDGRGGLVCGAGCPASMCPAGCVDLERDRDNCGACGRRCDTGEDCVDGECRCGEVGPDCAGTTTSTCCGTECVDLNTSRAHCGGCNRSCPSNATCSGQQCRCGGTADCRPPSTCVANACLL